MDSTIKIDVALTLRKSENLDDWFVIERKEHDGRMWLEPIEFGRALRCSARISDADVEGDAKEMQLIAEAIETRCSFLARRCAVRIEGDCAYFWSPRNSLRKAAVPLAVADALASEIRATPDARNEAARG